MEQPPSASWQRREDMYRRFVADLDDDALLRQARISWFQGLQNDPMWRDDIIMLAILCQECETRGLKAGFEALEGETRVELKKQGRLA
jgi:hypothetical protein